MFPTTDNSALFASVAAAGEGMDFDRFKEGTHVVALNIFEKKPTEGHGEIISADFVYLDSSNKALIGKAANEGFFVNKSDKEGGKGAKQRLFSLAKAVVISLGGDPENAEPIAPGHPVTKGMALVQQTLGEMIRKDQPWRGVVLKVDVTMKVGKNSGKEFGAVRYSPITQTAQQVQGVKAKLASAPPTTAAAPAATAAPTTMLGAAPTDQPATPVAAAPVVGSLLG